MCSSDLRTPRRMDKRIDTIPSHVVERLTRYHWPGNIRELENFMERCVILTSGPSLEAPLQDLAALEEAFAPAPVTLRDAERQHIRKTLNEVDGVIAAAAQRLGVPRSTLFYKMRRLGIDAGRQEHQAAVHLSSGRKGDRYAGRPVSGMSPQEEVA